MIFTVWPAGDVAVMSIWRCSTSRSSWVRPVPRSLVVKLPASSTPCEETLLSGPAAFSGSAMTRSTRATRFPPISSTAINRLFTVTLS